MTKEKKIIVVISIILILVITIFSYFLINKNAIIKKQAEKIELQAMETSGSNSYTTTQEHLNETSQNIAKINEFKKAIASAISDVGIATSENASAETMASNIRSFASSLNNGADYSNALIITTYYHYTNNTTITDITYLIDGAVVTVPRITANSFSNTYEGVSITLNNLSLNVDLSNKNSTCVKSVHRTKNIEITNFEDILETTIDTATNSPTIFTITF